MLRCIVGLAFLMLVQTSLACDVCGCSVGGFSSGLMSMNNRNFIALGYSTRAFISEHPALFEDESPQKSEERFQTTELRARYLPLKNLQLMAVVPYHFFKQSGLEETTQTNGWGDMMVTSHFVWSPTTDSSRFAQRFAIGAGLKLPTGRSQLEGTDGDIIIPNMQPGTGSLDVIFNGSYFIQRKAWGAMTEAGFQRNGTGSNYYRFGNRISTTLQVFRNLQFESIVIRLQTGLAYSYAAQDNGNVRINDMNEFSGGEIWESTIGVIGQWKNLQSQFTFFQPIRQYLANGYVEARPKLTYSISYLFNSK